MIRLPVPARTILRREQPQTPEFQPNSNSYPQMVLALVEHLAGMLHQTAHQHSQIS
jgi:hypothetical protein